MSNTENAHWTLKPLMRIREIVGPYGVLPISEATWWAGVKSGRYPKPVKLGPKITAWRSEDIYALVISGANDD